MKILMVTSYFESHAGGLEIVAGQLARALWKYQGFKITWAAGDATPMPTDFPGHCVSLRSSNFTERYLDVPFPLPSPKSIGMLKELMAGAELVLIHDTLYPFSVAAFQFARQKSLPVVIVQHIYFAPYGNSVMRLVLGAANALLARPVIAKPMLEQADRAVFVSALVEDYFSAFCKFGSEPVVILNGLASCYENVPSRLTRQAARAAIKIHPNRFTALFVGRFMDKKGLPVLRGLARECPGIDFLLVGWGNVAPEEWGLDNVIVIRGKSGAEVVPFYRAADIFLFPCLGDSFALVVQEAMACGTPVICTDELLEADPWRAGRVMTAPVDPVDLNKTVNTWKQALSAFRQSNAGNHAEQQAREVVQRYCWEATSARYAAVLRAAVDARKRASESPNAAVDRKRRQSTDLGGSAE